MKWVNNDAGHFASNDHLQSLALLFNLGRQNYSLQEVSTESRKGATNKQILEVAVGNKEPEAPFVHNQCYVK